CVGTDLGMASKMGHRADLRAIRNFGIDDQTVIANLHAPPDLRIRNSCTRSYLTAVADFGSAFDSDIWMNYRIAADRRQFTDIGARRVDKRDAVIEHQSRKRPATYLALEVGELGPVVNALHLVSITVIIDRDVFAFRFQKPRNVGQVKFALLVVV